MSQTPITLPPLPTGFKPCLLASLIEGVKPMSVDEFMQQQRRRLSREEFDRRYARNGGFIDRVYGVPEGELKT